MTNAELIAELRGHILSVPLTLLHDAADALEAANKRIAELEAQLPKEGEWIECEDLESAMKGKVVCSNCKEPQCSIEMTPGAIRLKNEKTKYCPNCGCRMDGETK